MFLSGSLTALQAAAPEGGATLTLGSWGVLLLALLLSAAAVGWILWALSRRRPAAAEDRAAGGEDPLEAAFRAADAGLADAVLLIADGRISRASPGARPLLGEEPERLVGLRLTRLAAAEDVLLLAETLHRVETDAPASATVHFRLAGAPGGGGRDVTARIGRPPGAPPGSFIVTLSDVSVQTSAARSAAEMASRIDAALSVLREGILVTCVEGGKEVVLLSNPGVEEVLGLPPGSAARGPLADLRARLASILPERAVEELFAPAASERTDVVKAGGDPPRLIERSFRPLGGAPGSGARLYTFRDLTREKAREGELRRTAQEAVGAKEALEVVHQELMLANEGLEKRMSELGRFNRDLRALHEMKSNLLANVSHELQTPLVSIRGYTEMILKGRLGPLTPEQERGLKVALRNIDRLISLIDGLLNFARSEKDSAPLRIEVFPLRPLVEEVVVLMRARAAERRVGVHLQFSQGDLPIRGDRDRIAQVFINLLSNAIRYNREGGSVTVEAGRGPRAFARVEVRDTGEGIPKEDLDRVFDRFYRGVERDPEKGTGLGLAITKDILRLHGCMIRVDSEPGKGSTFSFTLPLETRGKVERHHRAAGPAREES